MASWRRLGTWQLGARWLPRPLWKRSWAALGAVLAALGPLLAPRVLALLGGAPGESGHLWGRAPEGEFGACLDVSAPEAEKTTQHLRFQ